MKQKSHIDIIHIYPGTSGSAGLYLNEIYNALNSVVVQKVFVNHYYPFQYGFKIFYKYSELSSPYFRNLKGKRIRHYIRFLELFLALCKCLIYTIFNKVRVINYSLTSDLYLEYIFLKILRLTTRSKIAITCHDVLPFRSSFLQTGKQIHRKQMFFSIAHYLIIHNDNSRKDLMNNYKIDTSSQSIIEFPFPYMDINLIKPHHQNSSVFHRKVRLRVGMVGHLRAEKGLHVLLDAWNLFYSGDKSTELIIAGNIPLDIEYDFSIIKDKSVLIIDRFISDKEYSETISSCDIIVLPYLRGTNSGIPSSIISMNKIVVASDIPMFANNSLLMKEFLFKSEDPADLALKLQHLYDTAEKGFDEIRKKNQLIVEKYRANFKQKINSSLTQILDKN